MNAQSTNHRPVSFGTILSAALILFLTLLPHLATASSVVPTLNPVLLIARNDPPQPGVFSIHGEGFSPGGSVYVSVTSTAYPAASESFWTVATTAVYGPNGSQDPANGYVAAGEIDERIVLETETVYGPNGSQDPAQGYRPADAAICPGQLQIQAFDSETRTWSNRVNALHSC
jgi:hypothetical protein